MASQFCKGVTLPSMPQVSLLQDYDITTKNFSAKTPRNFYTMVRTDALINEASDSEELIISKINALSNEKVKSLLANYGIQEYKKIEDITAINKSIDSIVQDIKLTYCIYENLYRTSLDQLFADIPAGQPLNETRKSDAIKLNRKLLILLAGINRTIVYLNAISQQYMQQVGWSTSTMNKNTVELKQQLRVLQSQSAQADLHKRMSEYTEEKNSANRNLLSLYTLLNAVALGIIFYIAKD